MLAVTHVLLELVPLLLLMPLEIRLSLLLISVIALVFFLIAALLLRLLTHVLFIG